MCVCVNASKCGQQSYITLFRIKIKIKQSRFRPSTAILLITSGIRAEVKLPGVNWTAHHDVNLFIYLIFQLVACWMVSFYNPTTDSKQTKKKKEANPNLQLISHLYLVFFFLVIDDMEVTFSMIFFTHNWDLWFKELRSNSSTCVYVIQSDWSLARSFSPMLWELWVTPERNPAAVMYISAVPLPPPILSLKAWL